MPPLHSLSASVTTAYMNPKLSPVDPRWGNLLLILVNYFRFSDRSGTLRTCRRYRHFDHFVDGGRNRSPTPASVLLSWLASWFMGIGFRFLTGKWGGLSLAGSQSLLQQPLQAFYISPQLLDFSFECGIFLLQ